ncbi:PRC-barrel domain-containing protein [Marinobacter sp. ATCH36]|uniref:PRC-barrel domain-containing protein n=1 Tax=Marinobacter sp. ATCH36 TaxID=2945106 RepID=UPI00202096F0|nr:PRC-barrel domain-containing protein [Marinobacter sp. ATCH36]MCL7945376.1 PRC-barrel domain-containing protein [Marinobacter sp. ATCH36]
MKKLHSFAFYALMTPAIALGSSAALAQQSTGSQVEQDQTGVQKNQNDMKSTTSTSQTGQSGMKKDQSGMQNKGYMGSAPANGIHASNLIGAEVSTTGDEEVGPVNDLIIDQDGKVVGIVISVGGFLGMGEKEVAIGWDDVQKSGNADEMELRIDQTREELQSAPEFETQQ